LTTPIILHERLGYWAGQLRARLHDRSVRWYETRSIEDLDRALMGLACPLILIDLAKLPVEGLIALDTIVARVPAGLSLILNPLDFIEVQETARDLGATHVISGYVPPPVVASILDRWITLAEQRIQLAGWSRTVVTESPFDSNFWLSRADGD
jgi:hypothetical protein